MATGYSIAIPCRAEDVSDQVLLDLNELDHGVCPAVTAAIQETMASDTACTRYPMPHDDLTKDLVLALASRHDVGPETILLTAGSDAALEYIARVFADRPVHVPLPTYQYFVHLTQGRTASGGPGSLVYVPNPNNPTGAITRIKPTDPTSVYIIDQAYAEFATDDHTLRLHPNVLYTRTFSKAFGLAGLRIGYIVAPPELLAPIRAVYNEKQVTRVAKVAALATLRNMPYYEAVVKRIRATREDFQGFLAGLGMPYVASHANFVCVYWGERAEEVHAALKARGVHVRLRSDMPGYVRITVGTEDSMRRVRHAITEAVSGFA